MPYTINEEKNFPQPPEKVYQAIKAAAAGLEGKILKEDAAAHQATIQFHKTIHGQVLGDRTTFIAQANPAGEGSTLVVEAYPVDAVGRKLKFGARKGVTRTVLNWFWAHVEHNL